MTIKSEEWRGRLMQIDQRIEERTNKIEAAKDKAADAVAAGGEAELGAELSVLMAEIEALHAGRAKAEAELDASIKAERDVKAAAEMKLAHKAAKDRHDAAAEMDEALLHAERAFVRATGAALTYQTHVTSAGRKPPSHEKLRAGEAVRGAFWAAAPSLAAALMVPRTNIELRLPLAGFVARQTPWEVAK